MKKPSKCPKCNSRMIVSNENGELKCKRCGYEHSKKKNAKFLFFNKS